MPAGLSAQRRCRVVFDYPIDAVTVRFVANPIAPSRPKFRCSSVSLDNLVVVGQVAFVALENLSPIQK